MRISTGFLYQEGMKYRPGCSVNIDAVAARKRFNPAARFGDAKAIGLRDGLRGKMPPAQVREVQQQARERFVSLTEARLALHAGKVVAHG